jgi:hypothetical protein
MRLRIGFSSAFLWILRLKFGLHTSTAFLDQLSYCQLSLQNQTQGVLVVEGGNVLGWKTGLWSTEAKVWCIVLKTAWHWGGDRYVTNNTFGAPGSTPLYVCLPPTWGSVGGSCGTNMDHKKFKEKSGEGFSWIQILLLRWTFLWNQTTVMRFRYVRYCTLSEVWDYYRIK